MSIGLGLFLAALTFAFLYLYQVTQDRWNWRRAALRSLAAIALFVSVLALGAFGIFVYGKLRELPQKQTAYADLRLGMPMGEVKYVKGYPQSVIENSENVDGQNKTERWREAPEVYSTKTFKNDQHVEDYKTWSYELVDRGTRIDVVFDATTKTLNQIECFSQGVANCPPLLGMQDGTSESAILEKLSKPSYEKIDGVAKEITYENLGVFFCLSKTRVYMLGVRSFGGQFR